MKKTKIKGKKKMIKIIIGVIFILFGVLLIYWNCSYSPYHVAFTKDMRLREKEAIKTFDSDNNSCTKEEIAELPEPMQRFCKYIKLQDFMKNPVVHTRFNKSKFIFDAQSDKTMDMDYDLWLFYDKPYRSAYCSASMYGVPFDGVDYCTEEKEGGMKGILGKAIQIFDVKTKQGYQAVLITWVAESATINPAGLLSPYVSYEMIDEQHVKATIDYNGVSGSGIFTINEEGQITEFYSDERQVEKIDGVDVRIGWRCEYSDYIEEQGIKHASHVKSVKVFDDKEVVYFDSNDFSIEFVN